jgi:hypothetical protein
VPLSRTERVRESYKEIEIDREREREREREVLVIHNSI